VLGLDLQTTENQDHDVRARASKIKLHNIERKKSRWAKPRVFNSRRLTKIENGRKCETPVCVLMVARLLHGC